MSSQPVDHLHPVLDFAHRLHQRLDSIADVALWSMSPQQQRDALTTLTQAQGQLDALRLRLLAEAELLWRHHRDGCRDSGGLDRRRDPAGAPRGPLRPPPRPGLERHEILSAAMADGRVNTAQARAIVAALDKLPATGEFAVSTEQRKAAEEHLVALADHHDAKALRVLGGRIFEVIAPDLAEKFDGRALEAEEAQALRRTTFTMFEDDEGTCHGRFRIPARTGRCSPR